MKRILFYAASAALAFGAAAENVPYKSDIGVNYNLASDWQTVNKGDRGSNGFNVDRPDQTNFSTPGTQGGMVHNFDTEYTANCWLLSPVFNLTAGTDYSVSFWTKTDGTDKESFKFTVGAEQTVEAQATTLLDKPAYSHASDFEKQTLTFTPEADGTFSFGIHCYSDQNTYNFHVTGFSICVAGEDPGDTPVVPPAEARELPFTYVFNNADAFATDWTSVAGDDAYSNSPWNINSYSGWAEFDRAYGQKENNWLISPELIFPEAGSYMLSTVGLCNGRLEYYIGTDPADLSSFTKFDELELAEYDNDIKHDFPFNVETAGSYRIAVRACAESGSYMGYRIMSVKVKADKPVPGLIDNLTAEASALDELEVALTWNCPVSDQAGNPLVAVTKVEIYRNGTMVKEITADCVPGGFIAWMDRPEEPGNYSYYAIAYNENGAHDVSPIVVNAGYVGHPVATLPLSLNVRYGNEETAKFTYADANHDGVTWKFDDKWSYSQSFKIQPDEIRDLDDYLITPYVSLQPGYYAFTHSISGRFNNFEAGYVTDRHNPAATFVKLHEESDIQESGMNDKRYILVVDEPMEIALAIHATGSSQNPSYLDMQVDNFGLELTPLVPGAVTGLTAAESDGGCLLSWTNPTVDNAGRALEADMPLTVVVKRDGETIATLSGADYIPGKVCTYDDTVGNDVIDALYTVETANADGPSEAEPAEVAIYLGAPAALPYSVTAFNDWNLINTDSSWYSWELDTIDNSLLWDKSGAYYDEGEDYAVSPFFLLEEGKEYELGFTLCNEYGADMTINLVAARVPREGYVDELKSFTLSQEDSEGKEFTADILASAVKSENDESGSIPTVAPGKLALGIGSAVKGKIRLTAFSISQKQTNGVSTTLAAVSGNLRYAEGRVFASTESVFTVTATDGRILKTANGTEIDLSALHGILVVTARDTKGHSTSIKIVR